jgi:hypothetical protein
MRFFELFSIFFLYFYVVCQFFKIFRALLFLPFSFRDNEAFVIFLLKSEFALGTLWSGLSDLNYTFCSPKYIGIVLLPHVALAPYVPGT